MMPWFKSSKRLWILSAILWGGSCTTEPGDGGNIGTKAAYGNIQVTLIPPSDLSQGYTSVVGKLYDGPSPSPVSWKEAGSSGSCKVYTPKIPYCTVVCGSSAACVDDDICQAYATPIALGQIKATGLKTRAGATTFTMDPISKNYQPASGVIVAFPPFAEGETVSFSAAGDTVFAPFTLTAKGIAPLTVINDTITLADATPIILKWTPPIQPAHSRISVYVDISHHGGSRGKIECEGPDNGEMEIAADLLDKLKALGVSGFPKLEISRKGLGSHAKTKAVMVLESTVGKWLNIPGLISCNGNGDCPDGQLCQKDLQCK